MHRRTDGISITRCQFTLLSNGIIFLVEEHTDKGSDGPSSSLAKKTDIDQQDLLPYRVLLAIGIGQRLLIFGVLLGTLSLILFCGLSYALETKALELEDSIGAGLIVSFMYGTGAGILLAFFGLILAMQRNYTRNERIIFLLLFWLPAVNLVLLLIVNLRATKELKRHGATIDFWGPKLRSIKRPAASTGVGN